MDMLASILGIPRVIRLMGILKAGMNLFSGGAPFHSYEANVYNTNVFGRKQYNSITDYYSSFT